MKLFYIVRRSCFCRRRFSLWKPILVCRCVMDLKENKQKSFEFISILDANEIQGKGNFQNTVFLHK